MLMQIPTSHATISLQTKFEANWTKMTFQATRAPSRSPLGTPQKPWIFKIVKHQYIFLVCAFQQAYKLNSKQIGQKMRFGPLGPPVGPFWPPCAPQTMDIQNCQKWMLILTLRATIGLQTKFEANRAKNDIFGLWGAPLGQPWEPWMFKIVKHRCRF